jgi:predicted phage terminase large subunit-like protein
MGEALCSPRELANKLFDDIEGSVSDQDTLQAVRLKLAQESTFYLMTRILGRKDIDNDWLYDRCIEVDNEDRDTLYLWPRDHRKSSICLQGGIIKDVLRDPNITCMILSYNRPEAKKSLRIVKRIMESNEELRKIAPHIFYENPAKESPKWTEDEGFCVRRTQERREATVEAYGMVDSLPTGSHPRRLYTDDAIVPASVKTPGAIINVTDAWEKSYFIADSTDIRRRVIGTRYHRSDTYQTIIDRGVKSGEWNLSLHRATVDGTPEGEPVFMTRQQLKSMYTMLGRYNFYAQMLMEPVGESDQTFKLEWMRYYEGATFPIHNNYIVVDPAGSKGSDSDYTVMIVVSVGVDGNYFIRDIVRDKLNIGEIGRQLFGLVERYKPIAVGYEKYGMQRDVDLIRDMQSQYNFFFQITELGGVLSKDARIKRLVPVMEAGRVIFPRSMKRRRTCDDLEVDMVDDFINEVLEYPYGKHDDMIDCLARILDPKMTVLKPFASIGNLVPGKIGTYLEDYDPLGGLKQ